MKKKKIYRRTSLTGSVYRRIEQIYFNSKFHNFVFIDCEDRGGVLFDLFCFAKMLSSEWV